ncbi:hypothetical protein HNR23_002473 [Nocardiopsis mwathae]|uniref:Uncharacterized protein n=1 Tax=Nocardiopsis mwathae TaxID=1472723 RepID=A0A7X0D5M3_9ACTN|nr:hypothetical protein [Nocardiopsis mwathae]MBB6172413.1 hypothetical protein [Nocardiopsis mwathae]
MFQASARIWALLTLTLGSMLVLSASSTPDHTAAQHRPGDSELDEIADIAASFEEWLVSCSHDERGRPVYQAEHLATGVSVTARSLEVLRLLLRSTARGLSAIPLPSARIRPFLLAHEGRRAAAEARYAASLAAIAQQTEQDELAEILSGAGVTR